MSSLHTVREHGPDRAVIGSGPGLFRSEVFTLPSLKGALRHSKDTISAAPVNIEECFYKVCRKNRRIALSFP